MLLCFIESRLFFCCFLPSDIHLVFASPIPHGELIRGFGCGTPRRSVRERRSSQNSRPSLPAGTGLQRSLLADVLGPHERQPLEPGPVQVRIGHVADPLGPGGHGSIHAPDHWLRRVYVAAHEMGHYVLQHIPKTIVGAAGFLFVVFYLGFRTERRLGVRCRERFTISSWCLRRSDSATRERTPPGPSKRARGSDEVDQKDDQMTH